jgi:serine protease Do
VIVNPDGYILTNNHVVDGATDISVFTRDKKKYTAKVVGTDSRTDVAVLKIEATNLPSFTIGNSSDLKVGDLVFAIGDPFGIGETATMGIVSATGRGLGGAIEHYENFIQTDAAINPGNSGGALIDLHGNLIGVNTAILSGSGGNQGVGFAIPINMARNVMQQIVDHGKVVRGHLGVAIQNVTPDVAKAFGLSQGGGALVGDVTPDSPASKAGIQRGDVILKLNGTPVTGADDLSVRISETAPNTPVHLEIYRNGQTKDVTVTVNELSEKEEAESGGNENEKSALSGVRVENLSPDDAQQLNLPSGTTGVVITSIDPSSLAAGAGLNRGDVIQEVNHKPVRNVTQYNEAISAAGDQGVLLLVNRGGTTHYVVVQSK